MLFLPEPARRFNRANSSYIRHRSAFSLRITFATLLCSLIHRDSIGTLWITPAGYTETTTQNIGLLTAEGVDLNFSYSTAVGFFNSVTNFILLIIANLISRKLDQESLW